MTLDARRVARGSVGDRLIFDRPGATPEDKALERVEKSDEEKAELNKALLGVAEQRAKEMHTLTDEEVDVHIAFFRGRGLSLGERLTCLRKPEVQLRKSEGVDLVAPDTNFFRQNRLVVLDAGPDTSVRVRLPKALQDGTTKVIVDLLPGDIVEIGIYAMAEMPVEEFLTGKEFLLAMTRDVTRVIRSQEIERLLREDAAKEVADGG